MPTPCVRCASSLPARRTTCSDTSTFTQWTDTAHPQEFGAHDAVPDTLATLQQGYATAGECTPGGLAAAAREEALRLLWQADPGQGQQQQASVEPLLGTSCPLFARKFLPSAVAAWSELLSPVVNPR